VEITLTFYSIPKRYWKERVLPKIEALVGPGGPYEGYTVVLQGDNASPHTEGNFGTEMKRYFDERGWYMFNDQAPQGPHFNVRDLLVFPMMSCRVSHVLMEGNSTCSKPDATWDAAWEVWAGKDGKSGVSSSEIAAAFIQMYLTCKLALKAGGSNLWLANGAPHCGVRESFQHTEFGVEPMPNSKTPKRYRTIDHIKK
jgi:hypothetical protein